MIQIHQDNSASLAKLDAMLQDDPAKHLYRLDRSAFTDEHWIWQDINVTDWMHFDTGYPSKPFGSH